MAEDDWDVGISPPECCYCGEKIGFCDCDLSYDADYDEDYDFYYGDDEEFEDDEEDDEEEDEDDG